mgnify:CR=1 FL=1
MTSPKNSQYIQIKNYILKEDIGEGNFGKVKLGISKTTKEEFAIKIINKDQIKIKMKNKIFKENEVITKFNHINVIFVFEIIEDPENYYIVMEYCKRGELFDYIVEHERLTEDEAAIFFYQLINGVESIHSKGIAHRDLKPENLLLTKDKTLKIIDFGLSHEFDGIDLLKTKCGSPSYASPEILRGKPYDGFKSDVWSCGIILYAMVCGYLPFDGETNKILFKNIMKCEPEIPDYLNDITQDLILRILTSDPDMRITIDEIKRHPFYLRGKKLCHIDYKLVEKNVLKKRKNKSSFKLNEDDNTYFIAENNFFDDEDQRAQQIISRERKLIDQIIKEDKNIKSIENDDDRKSRKTNTDTNKQSSIKNRSRANSSRELNINRDSKNKDYYYSKKIEIDSVINNKNNEKEKETHKDINRLNNEMEAVFLCKRNNHENMNYNNIIESNNKNKNEQITPQNTNINLENNNNKSNKINKFLQNIGKNLQTNEYNTKLKTLKLLNHNEIDNDTEKKTIQYKSPDKIIVNKYTPTIVTNGNKHNHILNSNNSNHDNQIFAKIKNSFNGKFFTTNKKNIIFNIDRNKNKNKNSLEYSNNTNNENKLENPNINSDKNLNNNYFLKKSPDEISLNSYNQIKLMNNKNPSKDGHNLYYNSINININNYNIKQGNNKHLNYMNTENELKYKYNEKKLYINTENNKHKVNIEKNALFPKNIQNNNYISITDSNKDKKLPSKTQENFFNSQKRYNFDKISFHSINNNNNRIGNKKNLNFNKNIFGFQNKIEHVKLRGGSEGRPVKHSHLDNFLHTIATNGFSKNKKGSKKIYFCGPINIKVLNNNYHVNNNQKNQILPLMFKK